MIDTPIYDALRIEMPGVPLCQVCGAPYIHPYGLVEQEHWLLCWDCSLKGFGYAEERKKNTCLDCGKFPLEWDDHMVWVRDKPTEDGWQVDFLCRKDFELRARNRGINPITKVAHAVGTWFCFRCDYEYSGKPKHGECHCETKEKV